MTDINELNQPKKQISNEEFQSLLNDFRATMRTISNNSKNRREQFFKKLRTEDPDLLKRLKQERPDIFK